MPIITIAKSGTAKSIRAKVTKPQSTFEKGLKFDKNGVARIELDPGRYRLGCVATGKSGASYEVAVTDPAASACSVPGAVTSAGFDFGAVPFRVFEEE